MIALALLLQAATIAPPPQSWSILADDRCGRDAAGKDIVVCGTAPMPVPPPVPGEVATSHTLVPGPDWAPTEARGSQGKPCSVAFEGCLVGFGPPVLPLLKGAAGLVKSALAKKPDKAGRVAIPLDDAPATSGGLLP